MQIRNRHSRAAASFKGRLCTTQWTSLLTCIDQWLYRSLLSDPLWVAESSHCHISLRDAPIMFPFSFHLSFLYCIQSLLFTSLHLLLHFFRWPCRCKYPPSSRCFARLPVERYFIPYVSLCGCAVYFAVPVFAITCQYCPSSDFNPLSTSGLSVCVCVCVCSRNRKRAPRKTRMSSIGVVHHVYRNSMDHGSGLARLMASRVNSDLSDITLHVTPIDFHWVFFGAEWHQYHRLTPLMNGRRPQAEQ